MSRGNAYVKGTALPGFTFQGNVPMVEIDQFLYQGETNTGTREFFPQRIVHLVESIEYSFLLIFRDANTGIRYRNLQVFIGIPI